MVESSKVREDDKLPEEVVTGLRKTGRITE
jgi:hypothetical protein